MMKTYEVIVERRQPTCGGKSPKDVKMMTVTAEDPVEYVKAAEKTEDVKVVSQNGPETVIEVELGARQVRYSFTEE